MVNYLFIASFVISFSIFLLTIIKFLKDHSNKNIRKVINPVMIIGLIYSMWLNAPILADILLGWAFLPREFRMPVHISPMTVYLLYSVTVIPLLFATVKKLAPPEFPLDTVTSPF